MTRRFSRFEKLQERGIIPNRVQLARAIRDYGFPAPYELGANTLAWDDEEVEAWLDTRKRRIPRTWANPPKETPPNPAANLRPRKAEVSA